MNNLDRLGAYREYGYSSLEAQDFLAAQARLASNEFDTMSVDTSMPEIIDMFQLESVIQSEPVVIVQDRQRSYSEATFPTSREGIYFVMGMSGYAKNDQTLIDLFRSEWKKAPSQSGLSQSHLVAMSPGLNKAYLELLNSSRK